MMKKPRAMTIWVTAGIMAWAMFFAQGCGRVGLGPSPMATSPAPTETNLPPTPKPTEAPLRNKIALIKPQGSDRPSLIGFQAALDGLASQEGWEVDVRSGQDADTLRGYERMVFDLRGGTEIAGEIDSNPEVQFIVVGRSELEPQGNLSLIGAEGERPDRPAFMAGYLAAMITPDWRVGVISASGDDGLKVGSGFGAGVQYFCGLCRPAYPPYAAFPVRIEVAGDQVAASDLAPLASAGVQTIYVDPLLSIEDVDQASGDSVLRFIGAQRPAVELTGQWVASVRESAARALNDLWPELLANEGGQTLPMPVVIDDVNPELLSPGRLRYAEETLGDLNTGYIDTGAD